MYGSLLEYMHVIYKVSVDNLEGVRRNAKTHMRNNAYER